jgi:hypothetical protein
VTPPPATPVLTVDVWAARIEVHLLDAAEAIVAVGTQCLVSGRVTLNGKRVA